MITKTVCRCTSKISARRLNIELMMAHHVWTVARPGHHRFRLDHSRPLLWGTHAPKYLVSISHAILTTHNLLALQPIASNTLPSPTFWPCLLKKTHVAPCFETLLLHSKN